MERKKLVGKKEVAELLGVGVRTVEKLAYARQIPFIKIGRVYRFDPDEVIAALKSQTQKQLGVSIPYTETK